MKQPTNLGIQIFLYVAGILLVLMAILLMLQAFGYFTNIPRSAIWAIVLLAIGSGILSALKAR